MENAVMEKESIYSKHSKEDWLIICEYVYELLCTYSEDSRKPLSDIGHVINEIQSNLDNGVQATTDSTDIGTMFLNNYASAELDKAYKREIRTLFHQLKDDNEVKNLRLLRRLRHFLYMSINQLEKWVNEENL